VENSKMAPWKYKTFHSSGLINGCMTMPKGWNTPTEKGVANHSVDLFTEIAIYEQKRWVMDRLLGLRQLADHQFQLGKQRIKSSLDDITSYFLSWRNHIITATSFVATIIVGLLTLEPFKSISSLFVEMMVIDVLVGLLAFIVLSVIRGKVLEKTTDINNAIIDVDNLRSAITAELLRGLLFIDSVTIEELGFISSYVRFISILTTVRIVKAMKNAYNSCSIPDKIKKNFREFGTLDLKKINEVIAQITANQPMFNEIKHRLKFAEVDKLLKEYNDLINENGA
jgi:hypothetical protein